MHAYHFLKQSQVERLLLSLRLVYWLLGKRDFSRTGDVVELHFFRIFLNWDGNILWCSRNLKPK
uniref:Uncharacterized protein n=1 Tax=Setaria italica TaxID=4555 RepID=K3ZGM2_SETIT